MLPLLRWLHIVLEEDRLTDRGALEFARALNGGALPSLEALWLTSQAFDDAIAELENQVYKWADKYKPRKPRFFNRVHTGYEWNKYNQTHYDFDNPPPKIVQGYKINVFYPDLIDKSISPDFKLSTLKGK